MAQFSKIILYSRVSSADQTEGLGLIRQGEGWPRWLAKEGLRGIPTYTVTDKGRSAFHGHHVSKGELGRLAAEVEAGEHIGALLGVENLDRWSREGHEETLELIRRFTRNGVTVKTIEGDCFYANQPIDLYQIITACVKADLARKESQKKADRTAANWRIKRERAAQQGVAISKLTPAWIRLDAHGRPQAIQDRAALVLRWFEMAESGVGAKGIGNRLTRDGIDTWEFCGRKAKVWNRTYISRVLADRAVLGEFQPHQMNNGKRLPVGEPIQGYFPAIVPVDLFNRVNHAAAARKAISGGRRSHRKISNLFSGLVKCDECGSTLELLRHKKAGSRYVTKAGNVSHLKHDSISLVCRTAAASGPCSNRKHLGYHTFEQAMLDHVLHLALDDTVFSNKAEVSRLNRTIAERERDSEIASAKAERLWSAWADGGSEVAKKLATDAEASQKALQANLKALERQRERAMGRADSEAHLLRVTGVRGLLEHPDENVRIPQRLKVAQAFRSVIDDIWWDAGGVATVMLAGGAVNFRIRKGNVIQNADVLAMLDGDVTFRIIDAYRAIGRVVEQTGRNDRVAYTLTHGGEPDATVALLNVERRARATNV